MPFLTGFRASAAQEVATEARAVLPGGMQVAQQRARRVQTRRGLRGWQRRTQHGWRRVVGRCQPAVILALQKLDGISLKAQVAECKKANRGAPNGSLPTANYGRSMCLSIHLVGRCSQN